MKNNRLLLRLEGKKLFSIAAICLMVCFLGGKAAMSWFLSAPDENQSIYQSLLEQVEGPLTDQNRQFIESEKARRDQVIGEDGQIQRDYVSGKISREEYEIHRAAYHKAIEEQAAFDRIYQRYLFLVGKEEEQSQLTQQSQQQEDAYASKMAQKQLRQYQNPFPLYDDTGWEKRIGEGNIDYLLLLFLMAVCIPYFLKENENGMADLVDSSFKRNTLYRIKITYILALSLVSALLAQGIDGICVQIRYHLPMGEAAVQSLMTFGNCPYALTLETAAVVSGIIRVMGVCILMLFTCALCCLLQRTLPVVLCYVLLVFFPAVARNEIPEQINRFLFPQILSGSRIFTQGEFWNILGNPISSASVTLVFFGLVAAASIAAIWFRMTRSR